MSRKKFRPYQSPVKGGRRRLYPYATPQLKRYVESLAHRHGVSVSFASCVLMAESAGIDYETFLKRR